MTLRLDLIDITELLFRSLPVTEFAREFFLEIAFLEVIGFGFGRPDGVWTWPGRAMGLTDDLPAFLVVFWPEPKGLPVLTDRFVGSLRGAAVGVCLCPPKKLSAVTVPIFILGCGFMRWARVSPQMGLLALFVSFFPFESRLSLLTSLIGSLLVSFTVSPREISNSLLSSNFC